MGVLGGSRRSTVLRANTDGNTTGILDITGSRNSLMHYDGLDRLSDAAIASIAGFTPAQYSYNALDQITGVTQGTHVLTFTYSPTRSDELSQVTDNQGGTTSFGYDAQGNLASRNGVGYTFDVGNRLRNVSGEEGGYAYDGWGRRVAQTDASGTIYSFYDHGGQLIYQLDRAGGTHDYLYLGGKLVGIRNYDTGGIARGWHFQHTDALGSVIRQSDNSGQVIPGTGVVYDAWGGIHGSTPQDGPGYTGHVEDADTNLVYMQQRYYDPSVGRFLSMDPVDASGTDGSNLDRYWYANDNPYTLTDPFGMCTGSLLSNDDGTCMSSGDFTTQASNPHLVGATAAQREEILGLPVQMDLSQKGTQFIANHEGFVSKAKPDLYGNDTIGYGHMIKRGDKIPQPISTQRALKLLERDAQIAVRFVNGRLKVPVQQNQFDALTDTAFNSERAALIIIRLANEYKDISLDSFIMTLPAGYLSPIGLQNRRSDEANLYLNGDYK